MRRFRFVFLLAFALLVLTAPQSYGDNTLGIVLMHGKDGTNKANSIVGKLADKLAADFVVTTPEMPWSRDNGLNQTLENTFKQIDAMVADLKAQGATKIVIGGHSMGACAALAYATRRPGGCCRCLDDGARTPTRPACGENRRGSGAGAGSDRRRQAARDG